MPFTQYFDNDVVNYLFGDTVYTIPSSYYIALSTTPPTQAKGSVPYWNVSEPVGSGYARVTVANNTTNFPNGTTGTVSNGTAINFANPTATWGTVTYVAVFDAATGGNCVGYGALTTPLAVVTGIPVTIPIGALTISNS